MNGCKIGAFLSRGASLNESLQIWRSATGTVPAVVCQFQTLSATPGIPLAEMELMAKHNIIPFLKIEPRDGLKRIASGEEGPVIESLLTKLKSVPGEVRVSIGHEMNVPLDRAWYPWQGTPGDYRHAVKYFAQQIERLGANNVKLVFNIDHQETEELDLYYPGDKYISYLAVDGYNWGPTQSAWRSRWQEFSEIFMGPIIALRAIAPDKPIMIGEFSSAESGGSKAEWIMNAMKAMRELDIEAFTWFDISKEQDWRVDSSPASAAAFHQAVSDPYFIQGGKII